MVSFRHTGDAPILKQAKFKVSAKSNILDLTGMLKKQLHLSPHDSLVRRPPRPQAPCPQAPSLPQTPCPHAPYRRPAHMRRYAAPALLQRCRTSAHALAPQRTTLTRAVVPQFLYCHTAFAPPPDELVGDLAECFSDAQKVLVLNYSLTPAWG